MKSTLDDNEAPSASAPGVKIAVWDLPTRLFHWALVPLIGFSWWSSENAFEPWHFWSGYGLLFLLLFRILWGFFGSSTARFASFVRTPSEIMSYLRTGRWPFAGRSPLGALSGAGMLLALSVQVGTGLVQIDSEDFVQGPLSHFVSFEVAEAAHDVHRWGFNFLLALIVLHLTAILFYRLVLGRRLVAPMITGRGELEPGVQPMEPAPRWRSWVSAAAALAITFWITAGAPAPA